MFDLPMYCRPSRYWYALQRAVASLIALRADFKANGCFGF
jgi:hypothetical protein